MTQTSEITLEKIKDLYPTDRDEYLIGISGDYVPLLSLLGNTILENHDDDYSGDSRLLLEKNGKIGFYVFGWGSCSGCDALQGCNTQEEIFDLAKKMERSVIWKDSPEAMLTWLEGKDFEYEWYYYSDKFLPFLEEAKTLLSNMSAESK